MAVFGMLNRKTMLLSAPGLVRVWVLSAPKDAACEWLKRRVVKKCAGWQKPGSIHLPVKEGHVTKRLSKAALYPAG